MYDIYNEICNMIKFRKLQWDKYILRMGESTICKINNFRPAKRNSVETESASLLDFRSWQTETLSQVNWGSKAQVTLQEEEAPFYAILFRRDILIYLWTFSQKFHLDFVKFPNVKVFFGQLQIVKGDIMVKFVYACHSSYPFIFDVWFKFLSSEENS